MTMGSRFVLQEMVILLGGLSDCEELMGGYSQEMMWGLGTQIFAITARYLPLSSEETLETGAAISKRLYG